MAQSAPPRGPSTSAAQDLKQRATEQFERMADKATDQFKNIADQAEQMADQGHAVGQRMQEVAGNFKGAVDKSVKQQPIMTLMVAAALGFVLGALWKS